MAQIGLSRRQALSALVAAMFGPVIPARGAANEIPEHLQPLIREAAGGSSPQSGKVQLTLPPLAESGNSVPLKIHVDSPMTTEQYVKNIHVFSERNPRPVIARFHLSPQAGKAEINTRVRLAGTQRVFVVAVMSDGTAWLGTTEVAVTAAACVDEK